MALVFDAAAQSSHSGEPATVTWNHTVGTLTDGIAIVCVNGLSGMNAPTFGGNAMTEIISVAGATRAFYYLNPSAGVNQVAVTGGNIKGGGSVTYSGADQSDPIGATASEDGSASPNDMTLVTEAANSVRFDVLGANRDDNGTPTGTLDSGTLRCDDVVPQNQFRIGTFVYTNAQAAAGSDTHQWTTDASTRRYLAFEVKEAVPAGFSISFI